jgi:hypothetical protein
MCIFQVLNMNGLVVMILFASDAARGRERPASVLNRMRARTKRVVVVVRRACAAAAAALYITQADNSSPLLQPRQKTKTVQRVGPPPQAGHLRAAAAAAAGGGGCELGRQAVMIVILNSSRSHCFHKM